MIARHRTIWLILAYGLLVHCLRIPLPLRSPSASLAASQTRRQLAQREAKQAFEDGSGSSSVVDALKPPPSSHEDQDRPSRPRRPDDDVGAEDKDLSASSAKHRASKVEDEGEAKGMRKEKGKGRGKKGKHVPGQHHRDDRLGGPASKANTDDDDDQDGHHAKKPKSKHHSKRPKHGKEERRYLSSSPRTHPQRSMSLWDYDRHPKRMGEFNPVLGMESTDWWGSATVDSGPSSSSSSTSALDYGEDFSEMEGGKWTGLASALENEEKTLEKPIGDHWHLSEVPLPNVDHDRMIQEAVASLAPESETVQRQTLLSLNGLITFTLLDDGAVIDTAWRDKRDEWFSSATVSSASSPTITPGSTPTHPVAAWFQNATAYDTPVTIPVPDTQLSVLDGGPRAYGDRIIWQPTSAHPDLSPDPDTGSGSTRGELTKRRKHDKEDEYESEDYDDESQGRSRKGGKSKSGSKSRYEDEDEEDDGPRRGRGKHSSGSGSDYDDEVEDGGSQGSRKKHKTGNYEDEDDGEYSKGGEKGRKKHGYDDEEDDYRSSSTASKKHPSDESGLLDEDDTPHRQRPSGSASSKAMGSGSGDPTANDCPKLASFYRNMNGDSWTRDLGWHSTVRGRGGCCEWTGVTCDDYERVIGIRLSDVGLEGKLSEDLFVLDQLVRLDVSSNHLTILPDSFTTLVSLANFNASSNTLSGSIPPSLLAHATLQTLDMSSNALSGDITLNSATMTSLSLVQNKLTSFGVTNGVGLVKVDLSHNTLGGVLPDMSKSPMLKIFDVSFNSLTSSTGPLFDITRLTSLTRLDVRSNFLSGPFPATFRYLTELTSLYLSSNAFTGSFPSEPAPPALRSCYVMPNTINPCPSAIDLAHPESIVSQCHVSCGRSTQNTAGQTKAAGIPVSPLPGEAGQSLSPPPGFGSAAGVGQPGTGVAPGLGLGAPPTVQPLSPGQPMGVAGTGNINASPVGRLNEQGLPIAVNAKVNVGRRSIHRGEGGTWNGIYQYSSRFPLVAVAIMGCLDLL